MLGQRYGGILFALIIVFGTVIGWEYWNHKNANEYLHNIERFNTSVPVDNISFTNLEVLSEDFEGNKIVPVGIIVNYRYNYKNLILNNKQTISWSRQTEQLINAIKDNNQHHNLSVYFDSLIPKSSFVYFSKAKR